MHNKKSRKTGADVFAVVGESLIDLMTEDDGHLRPIPGGGPYNFARALARQGVDAAYLNPLSTDRFGDTLAETLAAAGALHLGARSRLPTSLAIVTGGADQLPRYSFYREGVADRDLDAATLLASIPPQAVALHTGALALVPPDDRLATAALDAAEARGWLCTLDVNMRPFVADSMGVSLDRYREAALRAARSANVVKVSDEDLETLGLRGEPQRAARALLGGACRLVVLTLGAAGAWAIVDDIERFAPARPVQVVDTVGAGDCFFAGFLAALHAVGALLPLRTAAPAVGALDDALRHAAACAALSVQRAGCVPPTWAQVREFDRTPPGSAGA